MASSWNCCFAIIGVIVFTAWWKRVFLILQLWMVRHSPVISSISRAKLLARWILVLIAQTSHWSRCIERSTDEVASWRAVDTFRIVYRNRLYGKATIPARAVKLHKFPNIATAFVRYKKIFSDAMPDLLDYVWAFEEIHIVLCFAVHILDIGNYMIPWTTPTWNFRITDIRFIRAVRMMREHKKYLSHLWIWPEAYQQQRRRALRPLTTQTSRSLFTECIFHGSGDWTVS